LGYLSKQQLQQAYSAADLFISTSKMEAFGKTVAESMACGTPVVCFDETGSADIVDHKMNGYLAKPFQTEDMITGIKYLLERSHDDSFTRCAIEKVSRCFDGNTIAEKYVDLYNQVLNKERE
jgi:glycosyltransferase involved in cell wall biosynthesis